MSEFGHTEVIEMHILYYTERQQNVACEGCETVTWVVGSSDAGKHRDGRCTICYLIIDGAEKRDAAAVRMVLHWTYPFLPCDCM